MVDHLRCKISAQYITNLITRSSEIGGGDFLSGKNQLHNTRNFKYRLYAALYVRMVEGLKAYFQISSVLALKISSIPAIGDTEWDEGLYLGLAF